METHASLQIKTPNNTNNNKDDAARLYLHMNEFTRAVNVRLAGRWCCVVAPSSYWGRNLFSPSRALLCVG